MELPFISPRLILYRFLYVVELENGCGKAEAGGTRERYVFYSTERDCNVIDNEFFTPDPLEIH